MSSLPTTEAIHAIPSKKSLSQSLAEVRQSCGAFEQVTFAYLTWLLVILATFHHNLPHAAKFAALHLAIAAAIAQLAWSAASSQNPALQFARHCTRCLSTFSSSKNCNISSTPFSPTGSTAT
ncbi:MAG: hypothetical protein WBV87_15615 [Candidatus Acidiferrales bacterium]